MQNIIKEFNITYKANYMVIHIELEITEANFYELQMSSSFVEEVDTFIFYEAVEYNPITKQCIKELQKINTSKNYNNSNNITSKQSYIKALVESLDAHWY